MKKTIRILLVPIIALGALGLVACDRLANNQNLTTQPAEAEQEVEGSFGNNVTLNTNLDTDTQDLQQEQLFGAIQAIDGMNITIDTLQVMVVNEPGEHLFSPDSVENEPQDAQDIIIRLTEQTDIEVRTTAGGQISGTRIGTLDDLTLQAIVMVTGYWQGHEFVATELIIVNF